MGRYKYNFIEATTHTPEKLFVLCHSKSGTSKQEKKKCIFTDIFSMMLKPIQISPLALSHFSLPILFRTDFPPRLPSPSKLLLPLPSPFYPTLLLSYVHYLHLLVITSFPSSSSLVRSSSDQSAINNFFSITKGSKTGVG